MDKEWTLLSVSCYIEAMDEKRVTRSEKLAEWIEGCKQREINGLVVSFPGLGVSYVAKELSTKEGIVFITGRGSELGRANIIYLDWVNNLESVETLDKYFLAAKSDQVIIAVLDDPSLLDSEVFKNSYASKRFYDQYWFGVMDKVETFELIESFVAKIPEKEKQKIWEISGGIPQIIKHLALRTKSRDLEKLGGEFATQVICQPMIKIINRTSKTHLEKLGIYSGFRVGARNDKNIKVQLVSSLLGKLVGQDSFVFDIKIRPDLLVLEDGENYKERLSRLERDILSRMLNNGGFVTKDQVAEIKWGSEEFSKFSDQAINKTMRRLDLRLHRYKVVTKWKTGYVLAVRNDD